jgi:hypothetical protein
MALAGHAHELVDRHRRRSLGGYPDAPQTRSLRRSGVRCPRHPRCPGRGALQPAGHDKGPLRGLRGLVCRRRLRLRRLGGGQAGQSHQGRCHRRGQAAVRPRQGPPGSRLAEVYPAPSSGSRSSAHELMQ